MGQLEDMRAFARVVESGSISRAAERLGVAKSAVSRRIAELEERLGAQLFRRTTRRLNLTDTGRVYYERCARILADVEEAEQAVSQEHAALRGALRVAVPLSFGLLHLTPAITEFMTIHPRVEFDLDFNDRQVDLLQEGFDVAIRIAQLSDSTLIARRLATVQHVVCASPEYLARCGTPQRPEDLTRHTCLVYSNDPAPAVWTYQIPGGGEDSVKVPVVLRASSGEFLRQAAVAGHGIIMEPSFIVYQAIERGSLSPILRDYAWPRLNAYAIYPPTRHLSNRVRAFVDFLAERFAGVPYWDEILLSG